MIYLDYVSFPSESSEWDYVYHQKLNCYDSFYPFGVIGEKGLKMLEFGDVTILYGGNGSGKTTTLNLIADLIGASHDSVYNRTDFTKDYLKLCDHEFRNRTCREKKILTSDGVFDRMIDIRHLNEGVNASRQDAFEDYWHYKDMNMSNTENSSTMVREEIEAIKLNPLQNLDKLHKKNMANSKTVSRYVRSTVSDNVRVQSNGESAFDYFVHAVGESGIYLLDEPENSLSPARVLELVSFLEDSARFYNCQLIISTHSPFVLAMKGAKIYDLDAEPARVCRWTELESVRVYYDFFKRHSGEFSN